MSASTIQRRFELMSRNSTAALYNCTGPAKVPQDVSPQRQEVIGLLRIRPKPIRHSVAQSGNWGRGAPIAASEATREIKVEQRVAMLMQCLSEASTQVSALAWSQQRVQRAQVSETQCPSHHASSARISKATRSGLVTFGGEMPNGMK